MAYFQTKLYATKNLPSIVPYFYSRIQELLDLAESETGGTFGHSSPYFSGLADVKFEIVAIDPYDGYFLVNDLR